MFLIKDLEIELSPIKRAKNEFEIEHWFDSLFDDLGINYQAQRRILSGKPDCLIGDIIIDFKHNISDKDLQTWVHSKGKQYLDEYKQNKGKLPSLLIVISESTIWYYNNSLILRNKRDIEEKSIRSLLECLFKPSSLDSEQFAILFGVNSPLYILSYGRLEQHFDEHSGEKTVCFQQWKKHFHLAYHDEEVGKELFLRHSYLSMLLKLILYKEFINPEYYSREYFKDLENYFELLGISLFHYDFFRWVINVQSLCDDYFDIMKTIKFKATDIFRAIYQEMIIAGVRHRLGEYYTPELLCKKMVGKSYELGDRVLDSSCGSGTFLIEIYKNIDSHFEIHPNEEPPKEWFDAINNIFGFDINPIAVLTTKANCLLYFKDRKEWIENISINVYLCNSIDPLEISEFADVRLGSYYAFCVDLIDNELELKIPGYALSSDNIETFQKLIRSIYNVWEDFDNFDEAWRAALNTYKKLSEVYSNLNDNKIKSIYDFFNQLYELRKEDRDHIWLYLLNNLVGIRILLMNKKMNLIITNPPWLTYKEADAKLKKSMKQISSQYDIKPPAQNITNIEEAVIFLYKAPNLYLRSDGIGKVAFVMPRSLLVSSQNEKARRFEPFREIEFFEFNDLVFNIDCCCIFAHYLKKGTDSIIEKYPIACHYLDSENMEELETYNLEPYVYFQEKPGGKYYVKKLIKAEKKDKLLPCYLSDYFDDFIQGADLIPKSLLYCEVRNTIQDGKVSIINPWISPLAKAPWKEQYYKNVRVESNTLFKATLSRQLYPFYIEPYTIFLPLNENLVYNESSLGPFAKKHWNDLKSIYQNKLKKDLFEVGINYRNKLCVNRRVRKSQRFPFKVVFPNAKKLMAAVVEDPESRIFIDSTIYYYGTNDELEAHYVCGMLNVSDLRKSVKMISDTRHHHKRPLYFNIPKFKKTETQVQIAELAKMCFKKVQSYAKHTNKIREEEIYNLIKSELEEIRMHGLEILRKTEPIQVIKEFEFH